jgi:tetratricopeptide (TPR) repeat protein
MQRMADIDMQRLDWRQAIRIFEQLRTIEPEDGSVRKSLIDLNIRLNQAPQAVAELGSYLDHLHSSGKQAETIPFLESLVENNPDQIFLRQALVEEFRTAKRIPDAVAQLVSLGDLLLKAGDRDGAIKATETIVAMNPPNPQIYQIMLNKLKSEA